MAAATLPHESSAGSTDQQDTGIYATYVPHDLNYSADFEDSLIATVLETNSPDPDAATSTTREPITIIPEDGTEEQVPGKSVRISDLDLATLLSIPESDLPLSLNDPRRVFSSPVPGVLLTHPGGYLEGGPGLDPDMDTFPEDFFSTHGAEAGSIAELQRAREREVQASIVLLRERLAKRKAAKERNEQLRKQLGMLTDQHDRELRIQRRMAEEGQRKKEARERRRKERERG